MKTSYLVGGIVIVIIIVVGAIWYSSRTPASQSSSYQNTSVGETQTQPATSSAQTQTPPAQTAPSAQSSAPAPRSFKVNGNDESADLTTITVPKGTPVTITFGADANGTYHGGLDFRSSVLNTGTIAPGSTKTVSFVANQSFSFTPYWPATNIAKPYKINIVVQ
ncbi:MAG: hypothetical protein ACREGH_01505 [Minisyncoccia bacterium]